MHGCFTSCIFAARTLDFPVKFRLVFRYEAVVFRRYVLALLSVGLLRKFEAYLVYLSLIWTKNPRRFSFFQKFRHFPYMLLWFHLVIPSFPARIDDMRSRFSALSSQSIVFTNPFKTGMSLARGRDSWCWSTRRSAASGDENAFVWDTSPKSIDAKACEKAVQELGKNASMAHAWNGCSQTSQFLPQARRIVGSEDENEPPVKKKSNSCACA